MQQTIQITTPSRNGLFDITRQVEALVAESGVQTGLVNVYVQGATAGIMIQENWDDSVQRDVISLLSRNCGSAGNHPHCGWKNGPVDLAEHLPL